MAVAFLQEQRLGALVLLVDHAFHLVVDLLCRGLAVGTLPLEFALVVVAQVGQFIAHTHVGYHAIGLLRHALQVVHGTTADVAREEFLGCTATQRGTHLVEHLLLRRDLTLLGQIPSSA